jgi:myo-inositol-1(or 4)-monophosphatase
MRSSGDPAVHSKGGRDLVTDTDLAVEDALREFAARESGRPDVGEELGGDAPAFGSYWLLDPICGTRNFASGIPLYCVNLALVEGSEVVLSVVGDGSTGEVLAAERGKGAWAFGGGDWRRLQTSDQSKTLIIEDGKAAGSRRQHTSGFVAEVISRDRWDFRSYGTSLSSAFVATGRVSAYVCFWILPLHAAAGTLLVAEAGGAVSDLYGDPWMPQSDSLIAAADSRLHAELVATSRNLLPSSEHSQYK